MNIFLYKSYQVRVARCPQNALDCMKMVREEAAATLNYADTLPNCMRAAFHDPSERDPVNKAGG